MIQLFEASKLKAEWAYSQFENLNREFGDFWAREPHSLVHELDPNGTEKHIRVRFTECVPVRWALIVGDIVHNLRTALDLLATDLARANGQTSKTAIGETYFPISANRDEFEASGLRKIKRLSDTDRQRITALKPYKGGNDALWQLHQLDIMDKHTLLIPTVAALQISNPSLRLFPLSSPTFRRSVEFRVGPRTKCPLEDGDILVSYPASQPEEHVDGDGTVTIAFAQGQIIEAEPVLPKLMEFGQVVDVIITSLSNRKTT
jgi:hypothetical protein